ncbi:MAG: hypothetical protein KQJ78_17740 [Deltaproteobacteria bacterium]|nr:hypothetical protein [Deltaproteobacteria bacterium]
MVESFCPGYLYFSLGLSALALVLWAALPRLRRLMLVSALLSAPFALFSHFFVPEYWQPQRLGVLVTGLEDLLFSLANGVIIIALVGWGRFPAQVSVRWSAPGVRRLLGGGGAAFLLFGGLLAVGLPVMAATLWVGSGVWLACLVSCRGRTALTSLVGGGGYALLYCLGLRGILFLYPEMAAWWAGQGLAGQWVWGMPLGEVLWSFYYGAIWPLFLGWTLGWTPGWPEPPGRDATPGPLLGWLPRRQP